MKILVLGGTRLVGRHTVEAALAAGHQVTVFNRGVSGSPSPGVEVRLGDRDGGLDALGDERWDAVIDVSGYFPRLVRASAERLRDRVGRYVFISTVSVYKDFHSPGMTEDSPLSGPLEDPAMEEITGDSYGPLKVLCEEAVREIYGDRATILRLGLVCGPYDHSDRFTSWVRRVAAGGEVLAPGEPDSPVQFVDARDVGAFALRVAEQGISGTYNVVGPGEPLTMGALLEAIREVSGSDARFTWVPERVLLDAGVQPWSDIALWVPAEDIGIHTASHARADAAGLSHTPVADTIRDTLAFDRARPADAPRVGLTAERERELLARRADHGSAGLP